MTSPRRVSVNVVVTIGAILLVAGLLLLSMESSLGYAVGAVGFLLLVLGASNVTRLSLTFVLLTLPALAVTIPFDTRFAAALTVGVMWTGPRREGSRRYLVVLGFIGIVAVVDLVSAAWAASPASAVQSAASMFLLGLGVLTVARRCSLADVAAAGLIWSIGLLTVAIGAVVLGISFASRADRAQGVLQNANALGIVALLAIGLAYVFAPRLLWLSAPLGGWALLVSQSRGAGIALAFLAVLAIVMWVRARGGLAATVFTGVIASAAALVMLNQAQLNDSTGLLRTNDSRSVVWGLLLAQFDRSPMTGVGAGNAVGGTEGLFFLLLAELGILGGICVAVSAFLLPWSYSCLGGRGVAFALALLINCVFEGWLLTGGSVYAWVAWLIAGAALARCKSPNGVPDGLRTVSVSSEGRTRGTLGISA
jgi:hypothetical protein